MLPRKQCWTVTQTVPKSRWRVRPRQVTRKLTGPSHWLDHSRCSVWPWNARNSPHHVDTSANLTVNHQNFFNEKSCFVTDPAQCTKGKVEMVMVMVVICKTMLPQKSGQSPGSWDDGTWKDIISVSLFFSALQINFGACYPQVHNAQSKREFIDRKLLININTPFVPSSPGRLATVPLGH